MLTFHCETCGQNYESKLRQDDEGCVRKVTPHNCPYPFGAYIQYDALEYKYIEGKRYERKIKVTEYSGHKGIESLEEWKEKEA